MPGGDERGWGNFMLIVGIGLLLLLIVAMCRCCRRNPRRQTVFDTGEQTTRVLRRGSPSAAARRPVRQAYAAAQTTAMQRFIPGGAAAASLDVLEQEVLVEGAEFHGRHVAPDSLMRGCILQVLRAPRAELVAAIRSMFVAINSNSLIAAWDDIANRMHGMNPQRWYQHLGRNRIQALRRALNNATQQLFLSESQGNVMTGTHVDVTPEAVALLGRQRIDALVQSSADLISTVGLEPQLRVVEGEIMLGHRNSAGAFRQYGYRSNRSHDRPTDPLAHLGWRQIPEVVWNTSFTVRFRYLWRYHPFCAIGVAVAIFLLAGRLVVWPRL